MAKESKKLPAIVLEDFGEVMEEVTKELKPLLNKKISTEEQGAANTFLCTLSVLTLDIFDYLPPEQQDEILVNCGTWFDIGMLLGRSPKLLVEILNKVKPQLEKVEVPEWFAKRIAKGLAPQAEED